MNISIVDTTLRDGEQKAGIALGLKEKLQISKLLDSLGIYQIEAGVPVMGGDEKKSISKIVDMGLKSKISAFNRMNIGDIQHSIDCGVEIVHISVPCSDIQIYNKLARSREWVIENLKKCIEYVLEREFDITIGLEDASRADFGFLLQLIAIVRNYGISRIRYADTVGIALRDKVFKEIGQIRKWSDVSVEIHTHNDFGMAVSNSIAAVRAGAEFIDCTIGGLGERAGNCNYLHFIKAIRGCLREYDNIDLDEAERVQDEIMKIVYKS